MKVEFFLPMAKIPNVTKQMKKIHVVKGKPIVHDTREIVAAKQKFMGLLGAHVFNEPITGAVRLITKWCYPCGANHRDGEWKITKPDTDNMIGILKDCMTKRGFWTDDCLVASEITEKFWSEVSGIYVYIEELEESEERVSVKS